MGIFSCNDESDFYRYSASIFLNETKLKTIFELGTGDATPIISAINDTNFKGEIIGFETEVDSFIAARNNIENHKISNYKIHNRCFFDGIKNNGLDPNFAGLISNPPYLPSDTNNNLKMNSLWGGKDGTTFYTRLLEINYHECLILISSYSNPIEIIETAKTFGYFVKNFTIRTITFGEYSLDREVQDKIAKLKQDKKAFFDGNYYYIAGVHFTKSLTYDHSRNLITALTSI